MPTSTSTHSPARRRLQRSARAEAAPALRPTKGGRRRTASSDGSGEHMAAFVRGWTGLRPNGRFAVATQSLLGRARTQAGVQRRRLSPTMIRGFPNNFQGGSGGDANRGTGIFEELLDFPCMFTFKVIGMAQGDFMTDIVDSVALALDTDKKFLKTSFRDKGKYRSITLHAPVNTASQIYDVYAAIDRDPRVKFKF